MIEKFVVTKNVNVEVTAHVEVRKVNGSESELEVYLLGGLVGGVLKVGTGYLPTMDGNPFSSASSSKNEAIKSILFRVVNSREFPVVIEPNKVVIAWPAYLPFVGDEQAPVDKKDAAECLALDRDAREKLSSDA